MANEPTRSAGLQTHATFNYADSDVILRSSDGVLFGVHKTRLAAHSAVFHDMFDCGTASADERAAGIPVSEPSATLEVLLSLCYPAADDDAPVAFEALPLELLAGVYEATCKYGMWVASRLLRGLLLPKVAKNPTALLRTGFIVRDQELAQAAAAATLELDILDNMGIYRETAGPAWPALLEYHLRCRREMQKFMTGELSFRPIPVIWSITEPKYECSRGGCDASPHTQGLRVRRELEWERFCAAVANTGITQFSKARVLQEMASYLDDSSVRACKGCRDYWAGLKTAVENFKFCTSFEM